MRRAVLEGDDRVFSSNDTDKRGMNSRTREMVIKPGITYMHVTNRDTCPHGPFCTFPFSARRTCEVLPLDGQW